MMKINKRSIVGVGFAIVYLLLSGIPSNFEFNSNYAVIPGLLFALPFSWFSLEVTDRFGGGAGLFLTLNAVWWFLVPSIIYYIWKAIGYVIFHAKDNKEDRF